jgi:hypothetical protein
MTAQMQLLQAHWVCYNRDGFDTRSLSLASIRIQVYAVNNRATAIYWHHLAEVLPIRLWGQACRQKHNI